MSSAFKTMYVWFLKNKMEVKVQDDRVYYGGVWAGLTHSEAIMDYWCYCEPILKKYAVNNDFSKKSR
jgi:hypothetical protein